MEGCAAISRVSRMPSRSVRRSASVESRFCRMAGCAAGSADLRPTKPRLSGAAARCARRTCRGRRLERRKIGWPPSEAAVSRICRSGSGARSATSGTRRRRPARQKRSRCRGNRPAEARARCGRRAWRAQKRARLLALHMRITEAWSCRFLPTPGKASFTGIEWRRSSSGSPTPESIRSCGELMTPEARITSLSARAATVSAPFRYSTPTARLPSKRMRVASALTTTFRLGRRNAGRR